MMGEMGGHLRVREAAPLTDQIGLGHGRTKLD